MPKITFRDLLALVGVIALFIPLMTAVFQYQQSVQQEEDNNFRAIIEKLSAGKKEERVAAASSMGTFIKKGGKFYDEAIDVLVNKVSIELDHNVLNAIRGSLEKVEKKDYKYVIEKLLATERNSFIYEYPMKSWRDITENDIIRSEKELEKFENALSKVNESKVNIIILDNLEKDIKQKQEIYSKFEKDLNELNLNRELVANFIASFMQAMDPPIKNLNFYLNSMSYIRLIDLELTKSMIYRSVFATSTISNTTFDEVTIINSGFTFSSISKSRFANSNIESSLFDQVIFEDVDFSGSGFKDVFFTGADLNGVNFKDTKGLKEIYFYKAKNIDKAKFDDDFKKKLDETLNYITEDEFKEYIYSSDLSSTRREDLFKTLDELKLQALQYT